MSKTRHAAPQSTTCPESCRVAARIGRDGQLKDAAALARHPAGVAGLLLRRRNRHKRVALRAQRRQVAR
jgi:hypothetical protein